MKSTVKEIAEVLGGTVVGDSNAEIDTFARIEFGRPGAICFFANPKYEHYVYKSKATAILVNRSFVPSSEVSATMIQVDDAYVAVASLLEWATAQERKYSRHRGRYSRIRLSAKLGKKVYVGDNSYIGKHTVVGDYTKIYEQVYIGDNVTIGSKCILYPGVKIMSGTVIGNNVIMQPGCVIGADAFGFAPQ